MVMFNILKNGLPSQMKTAGVVEVGFLSCEDRKTKKLGAPVQYSGAVLHLICCTDRACTGLFEKSLF